MSFGWSNLVDNQGVSFTDAQGGGFTLKSGKSHITSEKLVTKAEALDMYELDLTYMSSYASSQIVPKIAWVAYIPSLPANKITLVNIEKYGTTGVRITCSSTVNITTRILIRLYIYGVSGIPNKTTGIYMEVGTNSITGTGDMGATVDIGVQGEIYQISPSTDSSYNYTFDAGVVV